MATYPKLIIKTQDQITYTALQQKLLALIDDPEVSRGVNQIIGERANKYVPMKSGALRESMHVGSKTITWGQGLDYARYQYGGQVYGPNLPIVSGGELKGFFRVGDRRYPLFEGGTITGWFSLPGVKKQPTGRELGTPRTWRGWKFGYTTSGTGSRWIDKMMEHERSGMMVQITAYLKRKAKGLNQ